MQSSAGELPWPPRWVRPDGVFYFSLISPMSAPAKKKVAFFVDGYNLYHSIAGLSAHDSTKNYLKWVDLRALFQQFINKSTEEIADIYYFTAHPTHTRPDVQDRYNKLIRVYTEILGIKVLFGKFKEKKITCRCCHANWIHHEEKESDVNIAINLVEAAYEQRYDTLCLVTQDSDLAPAVKLARKVFQGQIRLISPPGRPPSNEISRVLRGKGIGKIKEIHLERALMNDKYVDTRTKRVIVRRPTEYDPPRQTH